MADLQPLFPLGQCVATPGALAALEEAGTQACDAVIRRAASELQKTK